VGWDGVPIRIHGIANRRQTNTTTNPKQPKPPPPSVCPRDLVGAKLASVFNTKWGALFKDGALPIAVDFLDPDTEDPQYALVGVPVVGAGGGGVWAGAPSPQKGDPHTDWGHTICCSGQHMAHLPPRTPSK